MWATQEERNKWIIGKGIYRRRFRETRRDDEVPRLWLPFLCLKGQEGKLLRPGSTFGQELWPLALIPDGKGAGE